MSFRSDLQIPPTNPPTAAQIAAAITASQGVFTPAPNTVSLTGTTQTSLAGQIGGAVPSAASIGGAVPQPNAIAQAAYLAGQRIVDTPLVIAGDQQSLSVYSVPASVTNGGVLYPATGQGTGGTNCYDVRNYHGFQMSLGISGGTRGTDFCMVRLTWYNDPNSLYSGAILHQETFEITNGVTYGLGQVYVCDRNHGPYVTIQFLGTNPSGGGSVAWAFEGTNREQDRFRITERLDYHPTNPAGNDGIIFSTGAITVGNGVNALGTAGLYSGEISVYAFCAVPAVLNIYFGSEKAAIALRLPDVGPALIGAGAEDYVSSMYVNFPRRPAVITMATKTAGPNAAFVTLVSSEF